MKKNDGVGKEGKDKNKKGNLKIPEEIGWKECKMKKIKCSPEGKQIHPPHTPRLKEFKTVVSFPQF